MRTQQQQADDRIKKKRQIKMSLTPAKIRTFLVKDLKLELSARKLPTNGLKKVLLERLLAAVAEEENNTIEDAEKIEPEKTTEVENSEPDSHPEEANKSLLEPQTAKSVSSEIPLSASATTEADVTAELSASSPKSSVAVESADAISSHGDSAVPQKRKREESVGPSQECTGVSSVKKAKGGIVMFAIVVPV